MFGSNQHIAKFLDSYLNAGNRPDYAVLISGDWGSGKTYFIKKYLGGDKKEIKDWLTDSEKYVVIYTSLFGAKSRDEMNKRVLEKLHPILTSKKLDSTTNALPIIGEIAGTVVSLVTEVPGGRTLGKKAGEKLKGYVSSFLSILKRKKCLLQNVVVVFDDVERADMPLPELLGYLNEYVEHLHVPCILLADEKIWKEVNESQKKHQQEIKGKIGGKGKVNLTVEKAIDQSLHSLSSTEEKVIGKKFLIQTSPEEIIERWFPENKEGVCTFGDEIYKLLKPHKALLKSILEKSPKRNYRAFKQSIDDLKIFIGPNFENIPKNLLVEEELNALIFADFLCSVYGMKLVMLRNDPFIVAAKKIEFARAFARGAGNAVDEDDGEKVKDPFDEAFGKIDCISQKDYACDTQKWNTILEKWLQSSVIDKNEVAAAIKDTIWFDREKMYWTKQIYSWYELSDKDGMRALKSFYESIERKEILHPDTLIALFYRLYWYASEGALEESAEDFAKRMHKYVDDVAGNLEYSNLHQWDNNYGRGFDSTYLAHEEVNRSFVNHIREILTTRKLKEREDEIKDFQIHFDPQNPKSVDELCNKISCKYCGLQDFEFEKMDTDVIAKIYVGLTNVDDSRRFIDAIKERFRKLSYGLINQEDFLKKLKASAEKLKNSYPRPLTTRQFSLHYLARTVQTYLDFLPKLKEEKEKQMHP